MKRARIEQTYRRHHGRSRPPGFVYCRPERMPLFHDWVGGPGRRVLDLGCRDGALASAYQEGNTIVGVDIDRAALAQAASGGIETVWADLDEPLPFEGSTFDVVVLGEVLEHLRFPERTLTEVRRVLKPDGVLVGSVPNNYRLQARLRFLRGKPPETDPTLLRLFSPSHLSELLDGWYDIEIRCIAGRLTTLHRRWFANDIAFRARPCPGPALASSNDDHRVTARGLVAAMAVTGALVFTVLPEALRDWPYNVF